jgi:hypothetical protein
MALLLAARKQKFNLTMARFGNMVSGMVPAKRGTKLTIGKGEDHELANTNYAG